MDLNLDFFRRTDKIPSEESLYGNWVQTFEQDVTLFSLIGIKLSEEVFAPFFLGVTKLRFMSTELVVITSQRNVILNFFTVRTWNLIPYFSKLHFNIILP